MPRPIRTKYTIPYGAQFGAPRAGGRRIHQGCDYHCPIGTPIYGTGDGGKVIYIGYNGDPNSGSGNNVVIQYPDGRITTDMHLRERTPLHVGSTVGPNTIVGYVGLTGNAVNADPPGSHDHHQMTLNGKLTDPESFYGTSTAGSVTPITEQKEEEDDMKPELVQRNEGEDEYSLVAPWFTKPGDALQQGYIVLANEAQAKAAARLYGTGFGNHTAVNRADYMEIQKLARIARTQWLAAQSAPVTTTTVNAAPVDYAKLAAAIAKAVNDDTAKRLAV